MSRCQVVGEKPVVWKDDFGWNCDQTTVCKTCMAVSFERLAEEASWEQAIAATSEARPIGGGAA